MGLMNNLGVQLLESRRRRPSASARLNLPFEISIESVSESDKFTRRRDTLRLNQYNEEVRKWSKGTTQNLKGSVKSMIDEDKHLSDSIKANVYYDHKYAKEANKIGFSFVREGVYVHKGAGKGQGGTKGSKWFNLHGERKTTLASSLMKMGTGNRRPKEWFDPVVESKIPQLADIAGNFSADMVVDVTSIYID